MHKNHNFKAEWIKYSGIKVTDTDGNEVKGVTYAGTQDNRSVYAYLKDVGFLGGWQYPHKALPFKELVNSINQGILYEHMQDLPNGRRKK